MEGETNEEQRSLSEDAELLRGSVAESVMSITHNSFANRVFLMEMQEDCKHAESQMKILDSKIQSLIESKSENLKIRDELLARNNVNAISHKSLFQTQSKLFDYKCKVKEEYIQTVEDAKLKSQHRDEIVSSYRTKWKSIEAELDNLPLAADLSNERTVNASLSEEEARAREELRDTQIDLSNQLENLRRGLTEKIVEFSRAVRAQFKLVDLNDQIREKKVQVRRLAEELKAVKGIIKPLQLGNARRAAKESKLEECVVDLSALDDIPVPVECLEMRSENDDLSRARKSPQGSAKVEEPPGDTDTNMVLTEVPVESTSKRRTKKRKRGSGEETSGSEFPVTDDSNPNPHPMTSPFWPLEVPREESVNNEFFFTVSSSPKKTGNSTSIFSLF